MTWLQLSVAVDRDRADAAVECLEAHGASAVTVSGAGEEVLLEPGPGERPLWSQVRLEALFDPDTDIPALRTALAPLKARLVDAELIAGDDWQTRWRAHAVRGCFAGRLWLMPRDEPFEAPPTADGRPPVVLRLDPGLAFGSGSHATTRLCLTALAERDLEGLRVLDYGCGSGVLAVAAALLGAGHVTAVDHDPQALVATRENAAYNHVGDGRLEVLVPEDLAGDRGFDVVVANILARPLVTLAPRLTAHTVVGGTLLLSGVLETQEAMIREAYAEVAFSDSAREAEWVCLAGRRKG